MRRWMAALLGTMLLVAACGGSGSDDAPVAADDAGDATTTTSGSSSDGAGTSSASGTIDACSLLSDEKIEEVLGLEVKTKGKAAGQGFATSACGWELDTPTATPGNPDFTISLKTPGGKKQWDILANQGFPVIPNVGDGAYQQGDSLWAVKGDHLVVLAFGFLNAEIQNPIAVVPPLADEALDNV